MYSTNIIFGTPLGHQFDPCSMAECPVDDQDFDDGSMVGGESSDDDAEMMTAAEVLQKLEEVREVVLVCLHVCHLCNCITAQSPTCMIMCVSVHVCGGGISNVEFFLVMCKN